MIAASPRRISAMIVASGLFRAACALALSAYERAFLRLFVMGLIEVVHARRALGLVSEAHRLRSCQASSQ